jgi:inosose dehydratase
MPYEVGVQSYTYRRFDIRRAIDEIHAAGGRAAEVWPGHLPPDTAEAETDAVLQHARERGVRICGYGVVGLSAQATAANLQYARRLGCDYVSVDVRPDDRALQAEAVAMAERLGLKLGIHNHGPGHHYDTPESVARVLEGQPPAFGACVDTGHFLRAGVDPVQAIAALGRRVHAVHLKDFVDAHTEVMPGHGRLDLPAALAALRQGGFSTAYVLEYEADEHDPTPAVRQAVAAVVAALQRLGA